MLVAQVTDIHLGFEPGNRDEPNRKRLDRVIEMLVGLDPMPDVLFATGDLVESGDRWSYERLREAFAGLPFPVHYALGNHDDREIFGEIFPEVPRCEAGFYQYVVETPALRCLVLDTLEPGRHAGAWCERRADWLNARLAEETGRPTLILLHHPPIQTGIAWMDPDPAEAWIGRLRGAVEGAGQVVGLVTGHIHRPVATCWAGKPLIICPSSAPEVGFTLAPIEDETPDQRPMIVDGPPGFALHWWTGQQLLTHFLDPDGKVIVRFDERMLPLVRNIASERPQA